MVARGHRRDPERPAGHHGYSAHARGLAVAECKPSDAAEGLAERFNDRAAVNPHRLPVAKSVSHTATTATAAADRAV